MIEVLPILSYFVGTRLKNNIKGEINTTKNRFITSISVAVALFIFGFYFIELFAFSGAFFLWAGMIK